MKRKLIIGERIMYVDAQTSVNCIFTVKILGEIDPQKLRFALKKIQQKHELLRMQIDDTMEGGPWFILNPAVKEIPVRVEERIEDDDWLNISRAEWYHHFNGENEPLARVIWLKSPAVSELLLVLPHCICDGSTCVTLMREMLCLIDDPLYDLQGYSSFNSVRELMPANFFASKSRFVKLRLFSLLGKLFFLFKNTAPPANTGTNYAMHWKFDRDQTATLTLLAKTAGTSVHAALCVAFMKAFKEVRGVKAHGKVICPVDIRKFVPEIKADHMFAFAPIVELTTDHKVAADFWERARKLKADLTGKIDSMEVYDLLWTSEYFHNSVNKMIRFLKATDGTHDITLSNMGRLDIPEHYQSFDVETIYSPTVAFPWRNPNTLVVSTFSGRMDFTLMSNNAFLNEQEAAEIRDIAVGLLLGGAGEERLSA